MTRQAATPQIRHFLKDDDLTSAEQDRVLTLAQGYAENRRGHEIGRAHV